MSARWENYYNATQGRAPREVLLKAIKHIEPGGHAVDIGAGVGNETLELLARGWTVTAVDVEPESIKRIQDRVPEKHRHRLNTQISSFEDFVFPTSNMVHSSYALPFCNPQQFHDVWSRMVDSLEVGGLFVGTLFGKNDEWNTKKESLRSDVVFHEMAEVQQLLTEFDIIDLDEDEGIYQSAVGGEKYWHTYEIIARKK